MEERTQPVPVVPVAELAREYGWQLVVLFGSVAREGQGRDVDLAVMPLAIPELFTEARWLRRLEEVVQRPVDLLLLHAGTSPLARFEVFRDGIPLYQDRPGRFEEEQDRAFFLHADARLFRQHAEEEMDGIG
ncbi:nucleotidyltransferase family protein [Thiohalospira sp.]|uniref:nucleotidyltransferase family protein n=1 Tax=Thiohalospira sp. TaxID=3080549 RepID=UPI00397F008A